MNTICCLSKVELPVCSIECYPLGLCVCERGALAIFSSTISVGKGPSNPQSTTGIAVLKFLRTDLTRSFGSVTFRTNSRFIILYVTKPYPTLFCMAACHRPLLCLWLIIQAIKALHTFRRVCLEATAIRWCLVTSSRWLRLSSSPP